jgi:hypothetical protein
VKEWSIEVVEWWSDGMVEVEPSKVEDRGWRIEDGAPREIQKVTDRNR